MAKDNHSITKRQNTLTSTKKLTKPQKTKNDKGIFVNMNSIITALKGEL